MVEKRWQATCEKENQSRGAADGVEQSVVSYLPTDSEFAAAFVDRKKRLQQFITFHNLVQLNAHQLPEIWMKQPSRADVVQFEILQWT